MDDITDFTDAGGLGLALLESRLSHDRAAFELLAENIPAVQMVWSATMLAAHIAQRAAVGLTIADTGEQVSDDPDAGLWRMVSVALASAASEPDTDLFNALSDVYRARDRFLMSLRDSVGDTVPAEDGSIVVHVSFWEGWAEGDVTEVILGVALALERLFMMDMLSSMGETEDEFAAASEETLAAYRRFVAGGLS